ncbi:MAG: PHP domain-containing protein [Desulfovibrio sp.]|nr:PHP domain-containing protein [Desulfovibrio sp.]
MLVRRIDLHTHSTFSDGTLDPEALVRHACEKGLSAIALTDHDTCQGAEYAVRAGREYGLRVIRGCELSATSEMGELHILGLWMPEEGAEMRQVLKDLQQRRMRRNERMIERLCSLGLPLSLNEVRACAGCGTVGRPHIARVLFRKGYVTSVRQAFERYIGQGKPAFVPRDSISPEEAVRFLFSCGATVSLAHPFLYRYPPDWLFASIKKLIPCGLDAIEAWHSEQSERETDELVSWAKKLGLGLSGGSDFHGQNKPGIKLGSGRGNLCLGFDILEALESRRRGKGLPV